MVSVDVAVRASSGRRFSAVLPTYNRVTALRRGLPTMLNLRDLHELIVVDDGSSDDTLQFLNSVCDDRLVVVKHEKNRGSQMARRTAIDAARTDWILMLEDDCLLPEDYGSTLLDVALRSKADIVGAPWVHARPGTVNLEVARRRLNGVGRFGLDTAAGSFPIDELETPFLPALVLARRDVFDRVTYRLRYGGNAWREETDLFVKAAASGYRCVVTPRTYSYQIEQFDGGQRRGRLRYEMWCIVNNWLFLVGNRRYLKSCGYIDSVLHAQHSFVLDRLQALLSSVRRRVKSR